MATARRVLIADPDVEAAKSLSRLLRHKGYQVHYAPDGSRALEVAVLKHPDVVLFDDSCTFLDARTFQQILRTNPRTEHLPVLMTTKLLEPDRIRATREGFLRKPFNSDEVLSRLDQIIRRADAAKEMKGEGGRDFEGALTQLHLTDLLQILAMNRRSGRLTLSRSTETGEIVVRHGELINARSGSISGEKALFRMLTWTEGTFSFFQGEAPVPRTIRRHIDDALLEGMRHCDETARLLESLPPRGTRISVSEDVVISPDQHPVTAQVLELLRQPRTVPEVLNLSAALDLEVLSVVAALFQRGLAQVAPTWSQAPEPMLPVAQLHALRAKLLRGRAGTPVVVAKVFVLGKLPLAARKLMSELPDFTPTGPDPEALRSGFGTVGKLALGETLRLDFCLVPVGESARPLWRPFSSGGIGALVVNVTDDTVKQAQYLSLEWQIPLVFFPEDVPPGLERSAGSCASVKGSLEESLRTLLGLYARPQ